MNAILKIKHGKEVLLTLAVCLWFSTLPYNPPAKADESAIFSTSVRFEVDKLASIWLIKRFY